MAHQQLARQEACSLGGISMTCKLHERDSIIGMSTEY